MTRFASELRRLRKSLGLTQVDLARILEVDQTTISLWEASKRNPTSETKRWVLDALRAVGAAK